MKKSQKMKIFKKDQFDFLWSKSLYLPQKLVKVQVSQNTFKNTPEDDLDTFCDIISHLTLKYCPDFLGLRKLLDRSCPRTDPDFDEH